MSLLILFYTSSPNERFPTDEGVGVDAVSVTMSTTLTDTGAGVDGVSVTVWGHPPASRRTRASIRNSIRRSRLT